MLMKKIMPRKQRGFTLTEAAIVLGIVGLILGAIWVAAAAVYNNMRVGTTTTQILQTISSIRSLYDQSNDLTGMTQVNLAAANAVPRDMLANTASGVLRDVWGTTYNDGVTGLIQAVTSNTEIQVKFTAVPQDACIALASRITGSGRDTGLKSVTMGTTTKYAATAGDFPITPGVAAAACASPTGIFTLIFRQRS